VTKAKRGVPRAVARPLSYPWRRWRSSLLLRIVTSTLVVGLGAVALLGAFVNTEIRDGLMDARMQAILEDSARDKVGTQERIDSRDAPTPADLAELINGLLDGLRRSGTENRGVVLLPGPDAAAGSFLTPLTSERALVTIISPDLRAAIKGGSIQSYQFVSLKPSGEPGVVVGAPLDVGDAGSFELYFVYSLEGQRSTLSLIQQVLGLGGAALVGLVVFMTWTVALQAVRPVRQAARVASRLAEGLLSERMPVRGRDEMATLASTFNEMAESLQRQITRMEDLSRLQRRFVSDVSHELRTPLTTVRMASDVLHDARDDFSPEVARSAELLNNQLDRFEALLADLLEISRIDAGAAQLEFDQTDVTGVVRDELEGVLMVAAGVDVELRLWATPGDHAASFDRPRVSRIVRNLISNAIEHAQGKPVDVLVASNTRSVAVLVRDYGLGMTHQQVERVFDRFWRADAARTRTMGGTGLGLSIAREDALLHGGSLEAWGSPGKGASFRLQLPRTSRGLGTDPVLPLVIKEVDLVAMAKRVPLVDVASDDGVLA